MDHPDESIQQLAAGDLPPLRAWWVRRHIARCGHCRAEWERLRSLSAGIRALSVVAPPAALYRRLQEALPAGGGASAVHERKTIMKRRWALTGVAALVLASTGTVGAREVLGPLRHAYAVMHQDPDLALSSNTGGAVSGITSRLDGVCGFEETAGMRWRVLGRVRVRVVPLRRGLAGASGETNRWDEAKMRDLRSRLSPATFTHLMGLNPVADPATPPELTVRDQGHVTHYQGFGDFVIPGRWRFEIRPLP